MEKDFFWRFAKVDGDSNTGVSAAAITIEINGKYKTLAEALEAEREHLIALGKDPINDANGEIKC